MRIELQIELDETVTVAHAADYIQKAAQDMGEATILDVDYEDRSEEFLSVQDHLALEQPHPEEIADEEFLRDSGE